MKYQILQENINQSETGIGGRELPVELYVTLEAKGHIVHFTKICFYVPLVKTPIDINLTNMKTAKF